MTPAPPRLNKPKPPRSLGFYLLCIQYPATALGVLAAFSAESTAECFGVVVGLSLLGFMITFVTYILQYNRWAAANRIWKTQTASRRKPPRVVPPQPFAKRLHRYADHVDETARDKSAQMDFFARELPEHPTPPRPAS